MEQEIISWLRESADFLKEQSPQYVEELIRLQLVESSIAGLLFLPIASALLYMIYLVAVDESIDDEDYRAGIVFALGFIFVVACCGMLHFGYYGLMAWIAPRVYVLEHVNDLL